MSLPVNYVNVDSSVTIRSDTPILEVSNTGLEHLEGQEVGILADGKVDSPDSDGNFKTVENNSVTLDAFASLIIIGIPVESSFTTLPVDPGDASIQPKQKDITSVTLRLYETAGRINVEYISTRSGKETKKFVFLKEGNIRMLSHDTDNLEGQVKITMNDPAPCTILGYYPTIEL